MTFDSVTYQPQAFLSEANTFESNDHGETTTRNHLKTPKSDKETKNDYCEDTKTSVSENEGGTNANGTDPLFWNRSINTISYIAAHIDAAETLMAGKNYDAAFRELEAAADRFMIYKHSIKNTLDASIAHLSTIGCSATPPHPKALPMVKLRQHIST